VAIVLLTLAVVAANRAAARRAAGAATATGTATHAAAGAGAATASSGATAAAASASPSQPGGAATATASPSQPLDGRVIVLDPGHGSHSGASSSAGQWEDDNVFAIAQDAAPLLMALGATVHLTRTTSAILGSADDTDLSTRVSEAAAWHADVFVSIHQNWSTASSSQGVETFYATPQSQTLASDLEQAMVAGTGLQSDGLGHRVFWVVSCNPMPAVLIEGGFLSNPAEADEISSPAFQQKEAQAITAGLQTYFANSADPTGAQALPQRLQTMCAMSPSQAAGWVREQYRHRH